MLNLLRGRVFLRDIQHDYGQKLVQIPGTFEDNERKASVGRGVIVHMGPPAMARDGVTEVPAEFAVGNEVFFVGQHKSRVVEWNGEKLRCVAQEEVLAVIHD